MLFLLSGEGPIDMGECDMGLDPCEGSNFLPGPIARVAAAVVAETLGYDPMDLGHVRFTSTATLKAVAANLAPRKVRVPGRSRRRETGYFYNSARALAVVARRWAEETQDDVVALLFRDSDTSQAGGRQEWQIKWDSMLDGFEVEKFGQGVPVLPRPTCEAWLLCLLNPQQRAGTCERLEERSSNPHAIRPLKQELEDLIGEHCTRETLATRVVAVLGQLPTITMPSFVAFRKRLQEVLQMSPPSQS